MKKIILTGTLSLVVMLSALAQSNFDKPEYDLKKNVIRWNMTPFLLWGSKNLEFGYERVITPNQSLSLNVGYREFPKIVDVELDLLDIDKQSNRGGFSLVLDYRRYFRNRNPKTAPDGLYWGPFLASYNYYFQNHANIVENQAVTGDFTMDGKINLVTFGVQLGYQFVIKNWISLDLVLIGPGAGFYSGELKIDSNLSIEEEHEYLQIIADALVEKHPGLNNLFKDKTIKKNGSFSLLSLGYRYVIQIGILF